MVVFFRKTQLLRLEAQTYLYVLSFKSEHSVPCFQLLSGEADVCVQFAGIC